MLSSVDKISNTNWQFATKKNSKINKNYEQKNYYFNVAKKKGE